MQGIHEEQATAEPAVPEAADAAWRSAWWRGALAAGLVLSVAAFYALGLHHYISWEYLRTHLDILQAETREHLLLALGVFFLLYVAVSALSIPVEVVLTLAAGALFGRWLGTLAVVVPATVGAALAFLSSRYLLHDWVQRRFGPRLAAINRGIGKNGATYLFIIRLTPVIPFFLVNLGMGVTRIRLRTFVWVSFFGMFPSAFLYANAGTALGTVDSPREILSPGVLLSLALLGALPLAVRLFLRSKVRLRTVLLAAAALLVVSAAGLAVWAHFRYATAGVMGIPVREFGNAQYPEDPAVRSIHHGQYDGRKLTLIQKDDTHFDFVLGPARPQVAEVVFHDVDVSLMTPGLPEWARGDAGLRRIALTERQWNRQQVGFTPGSPQLEVTGGDGFERANMVSAELAKNALNAGLWEVLLYVNEGGEKALYYQGWFTFPRGHYGRLFEHNTGLPYWQHWYYLEHWFDPAGTPVALGGLRQVTREREVPAAFDGDEPIVVAGEQVGKRRTVLTDNLLTWKDFYDSRRVRFAEFVLPGRYSVSHAWKSQFGRLAHFDKAVLRDVVSPATATPLQELELQFTGSRGGKYRFLVSGFDLAALPQLPVEDYPKGLYMPMGIGVPPFFQSYADLEKSPPEKSPYFSVLLDADGRWINHHEVAVDGPVLHRDAKDPNLLHVYLLSYERQTLIAHLTVATGEDRRAAR
jgi:uncharacterized membrane protein YdjX (TVP38/TMEM64 family)